MKTKIIKWIKKEKKETEILLRSIPAVVLALFVVSVISMNLLANKTIYQDKWLALDGGFLISWLSFLCMDIITKYFGPKASNKISILAAFINLITCLIFYIASQIPSNAGDYKELNSILGGTWFILFGSTIAFLASSFINNFLNWSIGKIFKKNPDGKLAYATQTYISTFIGQFFDNLIFSIIVFMFFAPIFWNGFYWTFIQCFTCALTGAILELVIEALFLPIGYKTIKRWKKNKIGQEYIEYIKSEKI